MSVEPVADPYSERLEENWGKPGNLNSVAEPAGVRPPLRQRFRWRSATFGQEVIPCVCSIPAAQAPYGFAAYYTYLQKIWKADAVLRFGTPIPWSSCPESRWA